MKFSENKNQCRVVVTGLGVVSSIGIGWREFWKNLLAGRSGITQVDYFDTRGYDRELAGQIKNFHPEKFISESKISYLGRASQLAVAAAKLALKDAGLSLKESCLKRAGVMVGTTMGEPQIMEEHDENCFKDGGQYRVCPEYAARYPSNNISYQIAALAGCRGENFIFGNACAAGNFAMDYAVQKIRRGDLNVVLSGGVDAFSRIAFTGFHRLVSIADGPCRPFDRNRTGMIPGEGSAVLILEEMEHARRRGAEIYAEILGCAAASDAYHMTRPHPRGGIKAVTKALKDSGMTPQEVDYICAHGTATPENDKAECEVFHAVFAERMKDIPVSSIKSMLGHTLGAASALESAACCLAIHDGKIPPTINYETPDPECDIDCVPNQYREHKVRVALNNSLAFGGNDACLIFRSISIKGTYE